MRNLKKILSLVLALMMVLSVMATASAAKFEDDADITYKEAVEVMSAIGVLNGVKNEDGTYNFLPKETLNRAAGAKIVAYIANGGALDKDLIDTLANPFTDVSGWAVDSVKYCYDAGIINGISATLFDPTNSLDGYAFGKMMLEAAGYDWQSAAGSNWKTKVVSTLKTNGLLTDLETLSFPAPMTREQACQLAWNIMQKAPGAAAADPVYTVKGDDGKTYEFATATEAYFYAQAQKSKPSVEIKNNDVSVGSLAAVNFGLSSTSTKDDYGRVTKTWASSMVKDLKVVLADDAAATTFVVKASAAVTDGASLVAAVNKALGLTGEKALKPAVDDAKKDLVEQIVNGNPGFGNLNVGDTVEVYASKGVVSKVVVVREKAVVAKLGKEITSGKDKGLYTWTFDGVDIAAAKDAYTKDAYYLIVKNEGKTEILDIKVPTVVSGKKITGADDKDFSKATYVNIEGDKVALATDWAKTAEVTMAFNKAFDYVLDSNGNVKVVAAAATATVEDPLESGFAYLLAAEKKVTTTAAANGGLLGDTVAYSWDIVAKAKLAMADGTTQVVDLTTKVTRDEKGEVDSLELNGVKGQSYADDKAPVDLTKDMFKGVTWVKYTVQKDGTYTLTSVVTKNIALDKSVAAVDGKTATSTTTWDLYTYDTTTKTVSVKSVTGIANFVKGSYDSIYNTSATNAKVITAIASFDTYKPAATTSTTYAYYVGQGDYDAAADSYTEEFYVNGETKVYFTESALTLTEGKVYDLTIDAKTGKISKADEVKGVKTGTVDVVDETFVMLADGTILYFSANCKVFNVSEGHTGEADTLTAKDEISYVLVDGKLDVIYITTEAN